MSRLPLYFWLGILASLTVGFVMASFFGGLVGYVAAFVSGFVLVSFAEDADTERYAEMGVFS